MYIYNHINANIPAFIVSAGMFVMLSVALSHDFPAVFDINAWWQTLPFSVRVCFATLQVIDGVLVAVCSDNADG